MEQIQLVVDLALAVMAAFAGGVVAQRIGQPVILGYLVAGLVIGPFTPGPVADPHAIETLAEIGVAFLMFALGAEVSIGELRSLGHLAWLGGPAQILLTMAIGLALAPVLGLSVTQGVFLGGLFALSSTVVVLKVLMARGELQAEHGRVALGILIAQDIAVVPMVIILPSLAGGGDRLLVELGIAGAKVAVVLAAVYLVGARAVPWVLTHAALTQTRELFILSVVGLALGTAVATQAAGLSLAFGAFLAGLVVAESQYRAQVIAEVLPLRDLFAALFFVSIGMLVNPVALAGEAALFVPITVVVVVSKALIGGLVVRFLGSSGRVALLTGLSIGQVGEFSFVLARIGVSEGAIPPRVFDLTLATALLSIVLTPSLLRAAPALERLIGALPLPRSQRQAQVALSDGAGLLRDHAIICGYGRVGKELADELDASGEPYVVIEYNPAIVTQLRARGVRVYFGDAGNRGVLDQCSLDHARLMAVLIPDGHAAEMATRHARTVNGELDIIARAAHSDDVEALLRAGATEIVQPELEAGLEVVRHALRRYGVDPRAIEERLTARRESFYSSELP